MKRLSQNVERVFYTLSAEEVRSALAGHMDDAENIVLPARWEAKFHDDGAVTITADYIVEDRT